VVLIAPGSKPNQGSMGQHTLAGAGICQYWFCLTPFTRRSPLSANFFCIGKNQQYHSWLQARRVVNLGANGHMTKFRCKQSYTSC